MFGDVDFLARENTGGVGLQWAQFKLKNNNLAHFFKTLVKDTKASRKRGDKSGSAERKAHVPTGRAPTFLTDNIADGSKLAAVRWT